MSESVILVCAACVALAVHVSFVYVALRMFVDAVGSMHLATAKLAKVGFVYAKAKNAEDAVAATVALENDLAALEGAEKAMSEEIGAAPSPRGQPVGFRGPNGAIVKFLTPPAAGVIAKIPADRLVYGAS